MLKISPLRFERFHLRFSLKTKVWKLECRKRRVIDTVESQWGCCTKLIWPC